MGKISDFFKGFFGSICSGEKTGGVVEEAFKVVNLEPTPKAKRDILSMPFKLGDIEGIVYGGPYRQRPLDLVGVKMAVEIHEKCDISVPTRDFDVPKVDDLKYGLALAVMHLKSKGEIYVGCAGGIGRTGLFLAGLAKIMNVEDDPSNTEKLPPCVKYVRKHYKPHALETNQQIDYITKLDVSDIQKALN